MKKNVYVSLLLFLCLFTFAACTQDTSPTDSSQSPASETPEQPRSQQSGETSIAIGEYEDDETTDDVEEEKESKPLKKLTGNPASNADGTVVIEIISPEEESFEPGQARFWNASIEVDDSYWARFAYPRFKYNCTWNYVLNGEPYQEQILNNGFYAEDTEGKTCGFTSTFIGREGTLEASVNMSIYDTETVFDDDGKFVENKDVLIETVTATGEYTVQR